jgi:alpha-galactosidase
MSSWNAVLARLAIASFATLALGLLPASGRDVAPTPPMGWNSWDAYGLTIGEADFKANAAVLASLRSYGWTYAVIDEGWYMADPFGDHLADRKYQLDANGLLIPSAERFPSSTGDAGFRPLSDWVHRQGLKFGIHIVRGIPKAAVERSLPIAGSSYRAADAADPSDTCPWDEGNFGVRDNAAGQAYYDSMITAYAAWGVDYLKVDCIADHPYKESEIRQIAAAIAKSGRPIVLSLSPGPSQLEHAAQYRRYSQMWRISNDVWDGWDFQNHTPDGYPSGVVTAFDHLAQWNASAGGGHWPDADMLPIGMLAPHPGMGDARRSRLTPDEARTQVTLWSIARSPLILGANLTQLDDVTRALITNKDVLAVGRTAWESHPISDLPAGWENVRVWRAQAGSPARPTAYVAFFNLGTAPVTLHATANDLHLAQFQGAQELWTGAGQTLPGQLDVTIPAHGAMLYRLE